MYRQSLLSAQLPLCRTLSRTMTLATAQTKRRAKEEGTIADVFTTLGANGQVATLPARFAQLKKDVLDDMGATPATIMQAWKQVTTALERRTEEIVSLGEKVCAPIPILLCYISNRPFLVCRSSTLNAACLMLRRMPSRNLVLS